uniref:Uncharacterized protein n=1 Tax=Candidatus Kentrum sp. MB TaxID=2138164 RepID=A0A451BGA9_9GAMM|nr:MAG: hypothetical protein BECKMB1821I_GA0114274_11203 [Candidatus Kentron sp. MB]VFK77287.1 MAG: hypothetical protein BECKMB1821H_GA0114242_11193 [Candidatus Kentron sp. MB]
MTNVAIEMTDCSNRKIFTTENTEGRVEREAETEFSLFFHSVFSVIKILLSAVVWMTILFLNLVAAMGHGHESRWA